MRAVMVACCLVVASLGGAAFAWTTPELLKSWFASSQRVSYVEVTRAELDAALPGAARRDRYVVYFGKTGEHVDGFTIVDDEKGQHEPITFGFLVGADGRIEKADVLAYRESHGGEIKDARFLKQLVGKQRSSALTLGVDVDGITGATISSRSSTIAAKRALALAEIAQRKLQQAR